jgi:hypothetical protein
MPGAEVCVGRTFAREQRGGERDSADSEGDTGEGGGGYYVWGQGVSCGGCGEM